MEAIHSLEREAVGGPGARRRAAHRYLLTGTSIPTGMTGRFRRTMHESGS
jgi:hypothetical protein